jgi:hypothetical protein
MLAAAVTLLGLNAGWFFPAQLGFEAVLAVAILLYAGTGLLISRRVPSNAIGWLLALIGWLLAAELLAEQYSCYGIVTAPGTLPGVRVVGWLAQIPVVVAVFALLLLLLLFPDGQLPSPRWRPLGQALGVVMAATIVSLLQADTNVAGGLTDVLNNVGAQYHNPVGVFPRHGWFSAYVAVVILMVLAVALGTVASVFARRRGAGPERRKQLEWLGYVGVITLIWVVIMLVGAAFNHSTSQLATAVGNALWILAVLTPVAGIPVACVVAVLKYRLYDIDRLISRTVSYTIVTGLLVGVYAGLVLLAGAVLPRHDAVTVAAATLVVAALFNPARRRVQRVVDRRFNRSRYDAELMIAAFAARLQDATELDAVQADLAATVDHALQPAHLSLWLGTGRPGTGRPGTGRLRD